MIVISFLQTSTLTMTTYIAHVYHFLHYLLKHIFRFH